MIQKSIESKPLRMTKSAIKARELVCKMYGCEINTDLDDIYLINGDGYFLAKDSALIAVDEIIEFMRANKIFIDSFWWDVRIEIQKI